MKSYDVVIVGSGLAGLQCARMLSRHGVSILMVDRKTDLKKGIHTTGIFVRKTFIDFEFPPRALGKPVRQVTLYSPKLRAINLESDKDEFRVGKMGLLYEEFLQECIDNGVRFEGGTLYKGLEAAGNETILKFEKNGKPFEVKTKVVIGADGAQSRVARDLGLDENTEFIVGVEEVYQAGELDAQPRLHCFLDGELAPGYLGWVTNDGEEIHIGVAGYPAGFNPREALEQLKPKLDGKIVDLKTLKLMEKRGGKIPVGGVLKNIACSRGLLIGDASGAVSPLTAGGLDPCMRLSTAAADIIRERLEADDPAVLLNFSGELFRARFVSRLWMRRVISVVKSQFLLELGMALLSLPVFKKLVSHVFFGRGSFPDVKVENGKVRCATAK